MNEKEPDYRWEFLHPFEEKLNESSMQQTLANLFLWNPDVITKYYSWDDALLMAVYNKIHKERQYESDWRAPYRVMPDFQNWATCFDED